MFFETYFKINRGKDIKNTNWQAILLMEKSNFANKIG